jgi:flagellar hook-associated protein 1 FlgK
VFGIDVSALQAFQQAIEVTSNNVANANTPGYDVESIELATAAAQSTGSIPIGAGVVVDGVQRAYSQAAANQLITSQSSLGQLNALQNYTSQIDNLFGTTAGGLTTALQNYYNGWSAVADNPTSTASRQALLGDATALASNFNTTSTQLNNLNTDVNTRITSDVQQINSISAQISNLNQQIVTSTGSGQAPNALLDQRDLLVSNLSQLAGVTTTSNSDGSINVFVGSGQPLVLDNNSYTLGTIPNQFNASQLDVSSTATGGQSISSAITSGDLGGLLAARTQAIDPAINLGANLFSVGAPIATASAANSDATTATLTISNVQALTSDNYVLAYNAGAYTLTDATTGANIPVTVAGTTVAAASVGLSVALSGTPAAGDQFLLQPTSQAAATIGVALTNPSGLAAAGAIATSAADTNTGSASIGTGTVLNAANPNLLNATTIKFLSPTTYSVNGAGTFAYASGANIALNGWQVQISGTPAVGDTFTVQGNTAGSGDNTNALAAANQATKGILSNGTISVSGAVGSLISGTGAQAQQVNTAQTAQTAVNTQAQSNLQSVTGVNLDEEAANLLQWQQSYQAAAQALSIANSLFSSVLSAVKGQ